ncbi:glutamate racemase, partial [Sinorhizobium meliloti]
FTSGRPDFATRRLMQGFGLRVMADAVSADRRERI